MVTQYGMSKKVGSVSFSEGRERPRALAIYTAVLTGADWSLYSGL